MSSRPPYADENHPDGYSDGVRTYKPVVTGLVLSAGGTDSVGDIDLTTPYKKIATFTVEHTAGVQVMTLFNKKNPAVTFDALDLLDNDKHLFGTEITISGGDLAERDIDPIHLTINPEGSNEVLKNLTAGVVYTITETKPVHGYGSTIYGKEGFHSPFDENLNGYSDNGSPVFEACFQRGHLPVQKNTITLRVEQRDGVQVVTIFNTAVNGTITGFNKEGEVTTGFTMGDDGCADVTYAYQSLEDVTYELYASECIDYDADKTQLEYDGNTLVGTSSPTTDCV